jgi:hypothetical protein
MRKVGRAKAWLDDAEAILSRPVGEFLFLAIQECIDLAAHWVADAGWTVPDEAGSTFELLAEQRALDHDLAAALRGAVGLHNCIAHGYASVQRWGGGVAPLSAPGEHRGEMSSEVSGGTSPAEEPPTVGSSPPPY